MKSLIIQDKMRFVFQLTNLYFLLYLYLTYIENVYLYQRKK